MQERAIETRNNILKSAITVFAEKGLNGATIDDIAEAAGKSKFLFVRQYRLQTGMTPVQTLWQMRCKEAVALLKYTTLSIKEISFRTGFSDSGHFTRRIKSFCGQTPSAIRKKTAITDKK